MKSPESSASGEALLDVEGVSVRFGGLHALQDVSLRIHAGSISGLIGPNGAGKTTLFNVITGLQRSASGRVLLDGVDLGGDQPYKRARRGLARTFQQVEVFGQLSVYNNLLVAWEGRYCRGGPVARLTRTMPPAAEGRAVVEEVMDLLDLRAVADEPAGLLPTGLARLVEVGRGLCAKPRLLLLDEPSAGLNDDETQRLTTILERVSRPADGVPVSILLVEHDVGMVMRACDAITVLDSGQVIAHGTPDEITNDPEVQRAYLGEGTNRSDEGSADRRDTAGAARTASEVLARPSLLEVDGLDAGYGELVVVHGVTFRVPERSIVTLLGPNGAGKTTVLHSIAGLIKPAGGAIRLNGEVVTGWSPHRLAQSGMSLVPERGAIFPHLTVQENLSLFSFSLGRPQQREYLDLVFSAFPALESRRGQRAGTLSGGEQRMLAIARALDSRVRLLMLDEISMGLAPLIVVRLFEEIARLRDLGIAVLLVEQFVATALELADYAYALAHGQVVVEGGPSEFEARAKSAYGLTSLSEPA